MERLTEKNRDRCEMCTSYVDGVCIEQCYPCDIYETYARLAVIEDILGDDYDLSRLRELVQADKDEKYTILPCKIGETLWCINSYGEVEETIAVGFLIEKESICIYYREKMSSEYYNAPIGKVLFLTREAAEEALKGGS